MYKRSYTSTLLNSTIYRLWSYHPAITAALLSAFSAYWMFANSPSLNSDATIYLLAADAFIDQGWDGAKEVYNRPFFPVLIGLASTILGTSTILTAKIACSLLVGLAAAAFVKVTTSISDDHKTQWVAVVVILAFPAFTSFKDNIIRDFGYWAFILFSLSEYIKHQRTQKFSSILFFWAYSIGATLFRPEALLIAVILPLSVLLIGQHSISQRLKTLLICYLPPLISTLIAAAIFRDSLGEFYNIASAQPIQLFSTINIKWQESTAMLNQYVLNKHSEEYAAISIILAYITIFIGDHIKTLGYIPLAAIIYLAWQKAWQWPKQPSYWLMLIVIALGLLIFIVSHQFLTTRYTMLSCLLILIPVCISTASLLKSGSTTQKYSLMLIATLGLLDTYISFSPNKDYVLESIEWIQQETLKEDRVLSNDPQISYRSGRSFSSRDAIHLRKQTNLNPKKIPCCYEYIVWKYRDVNKEPQSFKTKYNHYESVASFAGKRRRYIVIYKATETK